MKRMPLKTMLTGSILLATTLVSMNSYAQILRLNIQNNTDHSIVIDDHGTVDGQGPTVITNNPIAKHDTGKVAVVDTTQYSPGTFTKGSFYVDFIVADKDAQGNRQDVSQCKLTVAATAQTLINPQLNVKCMPLGDFSKQAVVTPDSPVTPKGNDTTVTVEVSVQPINRLR